MIGIEEMVYFHPALQLQLIASTYNGWPHRVLLYQ